MGSRFKFFFFFKSILNKTKYKEQSALKLKVTFKRWKNGRVIEQTKIGNSVEEAGAED